MCGQKSAARSVPAVDLKGACANISAAVDLFLLVGQQKEKVAPFQMFT